MQTNVQIALDLSPETVQLIEQTGYPLEDKIRELENGISIQREYLPIDGEPPTKDLAVIIIVSAAAAYLVMKGIALLVREINAGGKTMIYDELVPLLDKEGNPVLQSDGQRPVFYKRKSSISVAQAYENQSSDMSVLKHVFRLREGVAKADIPNKKKKNVKS